MNNYIPSLLACLLIASTAVTAQSITHGPIIGAVTDSSARAVVFADAQATVDLLLSEDTSFQTYRTFTVATDPNNGHVALFSMDSLLSNTQYYYKASINGTSTDRRSFMSYPCPGESVNFNFAFGSCMNESRQDDEVFDEMMNYNIRFFLQVGDWGYPDDTDNFPNNSDYFPVDYNRVISSYKDKYSYRYMTPFLKNVPMDYVWDDHDYVNDNSSRYSASHTDFGFNSSAIEDTFDAQTRRNAIKGYYDLYPAYPPVDSSEGLFHKFRFGNIEVFVLDDRAARSSNTDALVPNGISYRFQPKPNHSILGQIQREWVLENLKKSTATWKFVVTATAFNKTYKDAINNLVQLPSLAGLPLAAALIDSWSGFPIDQDSLINCVNDNNIDGVVMLSGDTHTAALDDGSNGGIAEIMAGGLSQSNSTLFTTTPLTVFGLRWTAGQGINGNTNVNDAFGYITIDGDQSMTMTLIDENGSTIASHTKYSCAYLSNLTLTLDSTTNILCYGDSTGELHLTAAGGTPPYRYTLDGETYQTSNIFTNVPAGNYHPAVKDASGCTLEVCARLTEPAKFKVAINITHPLCPDDVDGTIDLLATGGVPPYTLIWGDGDTTYNRTNLVGGFYPFTLTDQNGCVITENVEVITPDSLYAAEFSTLASCVDANDATATLTPRGGTAPYTIEWANGSNSLTRNNLQAGTYTYTLTDNNNCVMTDTILVGSRAGLLLDATVTPDNGSGTGSISITVTGGTGNYTFGWFDGSSGTSVSGLYTGNYPLTVTDLNGCILDTSIYVNLNTVGISETELSDLEIFPNPTRGILNVNLQLSSSSKIELEVFDISGRKLMARSIDRTTELKTQLDLSQLPTSPVWIKVTTNERSFYKKVVVLGR